MNLAYLSCLFLIAGGVSGFGVFKQLIAFGHQLVNLALAALVHFVALLSVLLQSAYDLLDRSKGCIDLSRSS